MMFNHNRTTGNNQLQLSTDFSMISSMMAIEVSVMNTTIADYSILKPYTNGNYNLKLKIILNSNYIMHEIIFPTPVKSEKQIVFILGVVMSYSCHQNQ